MQYMLANFLLSILPPTRLFSLKRALLSFLGISVGEGSNICGGVKFFGGGRVIIGDHCWIGLGAKFYTSPGADVTIGNRCDIAPEVSFMCGTHVIGDAERRAGSGYSNPIEVQDGCWIGIGSTLLGGSLVGASSIVAARSLLLGKQYPADSLLAGAPAAVKRSLLTSFDQAVSDA